MKTKSFFSLIAAAFVAVACQPKGPEFTPSFEVNGASLKDGKIAVEAAGANAKLAVASNVSWAVDASEDWVVVTPAKADITDKALKTTEVTVAVSANEAYEPRQATLTLSATDVNLPSIVVTINQAAAVKPEAVFQVLDSDFKDVTSLDVVAAAGNASVIVNANVSWTASADAAWCTIEPANATIEGYEETPTVVTLSFEANAVAEARSCNVTFTPAEGEPVVVAINQAAKKVYSITITESGLTASTFVANFKCSDAEAYFLPSVETEWYEQYPDKAELAAADLAYWKNKYGTTYAQYGFDSFEDLFFNALAVQDEYDYDMEGECDPETTYHAYAFVVNEDYTVGSDVFAKDITTKASQLSFYGTAVWHDVFVSTIFDMSGTVIDMPCDVYTDASAPGVFYFDSPYNYANIAAWFEETPESMKQYTGNWKRVSIAIDCSKPSECKMALQGLGVSMSSTYGWISGGFGYGYTVDSYGVYADNKITFAADGSRTVLWAMSNYSSGSTKGNTLKDDFTVTITKGGSPIYPGSVAPSSARNAKAARKVFAPVKKANFVELR